MGAPEGQDPQGVQHQLDTLKRVVLFDDFLEIVATGSSPSMVAPVQIDISPFVSATAIAGLFSLLIQPLANAYWDLFLQTDLTTVNNVHIQSLAGTINQFRENYGIQNIADDKTLYYRSAKISGGGNASWIVRLHGYIDKA